MMPVDEWAECASELLAVHQETRGGRPQPVTISKTRYTGVVSAIDMERVPVDGGWDFSGGFTVQIPLAQFRRGILPRRNAVVKYEGYELRLYSADVINAMVEVIAANISP